MIKKIESFIENNRYNFEKQNIEIFENIDEDSAYWDFISEKTVGRIVVWSDYRIELEILNIATELQVFFKYYEFKDNNFDELILFNFLDELKRG